MRFARWGLALAAIAKALILAATHPNTRQIPRDTSWQASRMASAHTWLPATCAAAAADAADNPPLRMAPKNEAVARFHALNLAVVLPAAGDGNCLVRCIVHAVYGTVLAHPLARAMIILQCSEQAHRYQPFVTGGDFPASLLDRVKNRV